MVNIKLDNVAIIVRADGNNPLLLNPDFLKLNHIISENWEIENVLVTPPFAQVIYKNSLTITVEQNKLQFVCSNPDGIDWKKELPRIATTYMAILPHVPYKAVGLNFSLSSLDYKAREADTQVVKKLLNHGPWFEFHNGITGASVELQYRTSLPNLNVRVAVRGELLGFDANFHHDFEPTQSKERAAYINTLEEQYNKFLQLMKLLPL
jgi:hypothetical protein